MKRTKTFVTKFLSVLAVGAIVLSSCTKDLEDRLDKVEETLSTVVKTVDELKAELEKMSAKSDVTLASVTDPATGKVTLTFTGADGKKEIITFDGKNDGNDKAVVTVVPDPNKPGYSLVTVDGVPFSFPTSVPANVTSIVLTSDTYQVATEGQILKLNYKFNTSTGAALDVDPSAATLSVWQTKTKAESALETTELVTIAGAEKVIGGAKNEYQITFKVSSLTAEQLAAGDEIFSLFRIQLENNDLTLSESVELSVNPIGTMTKFQYIGNNSSEDFAASPMTFDPIVVNELDGTFTEVKDIVDIDFLRGGLGAVDPEQMENVVIKVYECEASALASLPAYFFTSGVQATIDDQDTKFAAWVADANNKVKEISNVATQGVREEDAKDFVINVDATALAKTITGYGAKTFVITMNGKLISTNGKAFRGVGTYEVTKRLGLQMADVNVKYVAETASSNLAFDVTYTKQKYSVLTGKNTYTGAVAVAVTGSDNKPYAATVTGKLDAQEYFTYSVTMDQKLYPAGTYKVVISLTEDNKVYEFIQNVIVTRPTSDLKTKTPATADLGYAVTGKAASFNSYAPVLKADGTYDGTKLVKKFDVTKVFASNVASPDAAKITEGTNYKIVYLPYTLAADGTTKTYVAGLPTFDNVKFIDTPTTEFAVAEVAANSTLQFDKVYNLDVIVIYATGFKDLVKTDYTMVYNTKPITGFLTTSGSTAVWSKARVATLGFGSTTDKISVAYLKNDVKPFYFGNEAKETAIADDENAQVDAFFYSITSITYNVEKITVSKDNLASFTAAGTALNEGDKLSFVKTAGTDTEKLSYLEVRNVTNAQLTYVADAKVSALTAPVKQIVKATVVDIWGISRTFDIEVTINPATK